MLPTDPYSPPQSSFDGLTQEQQLARERGELRYAGFWIRLGAQLIDGLIFLPLVAIDVIFGGQSHAVQLVLLILSTLAALYIGIAMVARYGGSPGKLLLGLRIVKLDGAPVRLKAAVLRYSVIGTVYLAIAVLTVAAVLSMSDASLQSLSYLERNAALEEAVPAISTLNYAMMAWGLAVMVALLINAKSRTLHDFIAGTAVVRQ